MKDRMMTEAMIWPVKMSDQKASQAGCRVNRAASEERSIMVEFPDRY